MSEDSTSIPPQDSTINLHRRRPRYRGTHPRKFDEKYKELAPERYLETVAKVIASGKTPAGTHRSIMVAEILDALAPKPGEIAVDCTLGYGGHAQEMLSRLLPGGRLLGLDADPIELPKTEARLRALDFGADVFTTHRSNFAGLPQVLSAFFSSLSVNRPTPNPSEEGSRTADARLPFPSSEGLGVGSVAGVCGADIVLADLGVSSMQIDDPARGFSVKLDGPLDMRMNPQRGQPASDFLQKIKPAALVSLLGANSDEPHAATLAPLLAGKHFATTRALSDAIRKALPRLNKDDVNMSVRRVFQTLRIAVNDEFSALETFLRNLPQCLNPGGRVAVLTFHSGEDRRVKKAFEAGFRDGLYSEIAREVVRPTPEERNSNPRSGPAKLRWAKRV